MEIAMTHQTDSLPDTTPLWRYMKLSTFFMLLRGRAFFPAVATLQAGDPMEVLPYEEAKAIESVIKSHY